MSEMLQDLRYAFRSLRRSPGFTLMVVATLAAGIGANTAIFSAVDAVLLRPLPYPRSDRLVEVTSSVLEPIGFGVSYPDLLDLRGMTRDFSGVAGYSTQRYNLSGAGDPREVQVAFVTADLFDVLGVHPQLGAAFTPAQEHEPIALLSNALWATSYGRDPQVLGRSVALDGKTYTIAGVMPAGFSFPGDEIQVWTPIGGVAAKQPRALSDRGFHALNAVARMAPEATLPQLRGDLNVLARRIATVTADDGLRLTATPLRDAVVGDVGSRLWVLLGAVGLVLLIACANAANLLLARATTRRREMAIRRAMGAGRARLMRQLLTESVVLAFAGAALGLVLATWGLDTLLAVWPQALPRGAELGLDGRVLAFTAGLAALTGIGFGLAPALRASSPHIEEALRDDTTGSGGSRRGRRAQNALIVAEVALALVLLVGAGLLVRSFIALNRVNPGFDTRDVLAARIRLTPARYAQRPAQEQFFNTVLASLATRSDVASAGLTNSLPLSGAVNIMAFDPHTIRPDYPHKYMAATMSVVTPDYFTTLRIPVRGRGFTAEDRPGSPRVLVVSAEFARQLWPGLDPVGRQLPLARWIGATGPQLFTIVGVVDDMRWGTLDEAGVQPAVYAPAAQEGGQSEMWVVTRSRSGAPLNLAAAIRDAVQAADPQQPIGDIVTLAQLIDRQTVARRFNTTLLAVFAALALVLALVGIYGVTSYAVSQRIRELGIRLALGATPRDVVRLLVGESLGRVATGVVAGLALALALTRALGSMLFGVEPRDMATFSLAALLFAAVALVATWLPARRATRVDPMVALRNEP